MLPTPMKPLRVLVVEDEPLIAMLLSDILIDMGHSVCAVESTEKGAVAAALAYRPEMIIADDRLAEGSGTSALAQILERGFVPHVLVTGDNSARERLHARAVILRKPFLEAELAVAMRRAIGATEWS